MTLASIGQDSVRRSVGLRDQRLAALLADLGALGLHGRVLTEWITDEQDVRLQAWRDGSGVTVELLWCRDDAPPPAHLDVVRIAGEKRQVWRSPNNRCLTVQVVRFLYDLLLLEEDTLSKRYQLLG